jgi:protein-L-isoaspartate(D-aspartate) O-methyltransferase
MKIETIMEVIPRRFFIGEYHNRKRYKDTAVPIGRGVNCTAPSQIKNMLELLGPCNRVLEIGTGCGWQTALLTVMCEEVYSIEYDRRLYERAEYNLRGYNVKLKCGDGFEGWVEHAQFNGIIACTAIPEIPDDLLRQLAPDGVMVCPVGDSKKQVLTRITKQNDLLQVEEYEECGFVVAS